MQSFYNNINAQRLCKCGLAAMMFLMGASLPALAQDEAEETGDVVSIPVKRPAKPVKKYPMMEIKGKVVDAATNEPLAGVKLHAYNNSNYTAMTDEEGEYTISVPTFVTSIVTEYEDYNTNRVSLNGRSEGVNISIYSSKYLKDYSSGSSASKSVATAGFEQSTAITPDQELQNRLTGDVRTMQRSALPGQGVAMFINGLNSLNSNAMPLFIVDGVVYDMMYDSDNIHNGYFTNLLEAISLDDVASIEVLKNGTAIYGAKAANGVVVIKTKRSTSMATRIDVNIHAGVELQPKTMDMMDAEQYRGYAAGLLKGNTSGLTEYKFLNTDPNYYYYNMYHNNTDWREYVSREAFNQNYSIGIMGGDDVAAYNLSVGFMDSQSTLKMNDMERFNIRFNADINFNQWFTTQFDASYTNVTRDLRDDGLTSDYRATAISSPGFLALAKAPFLSPYDFSTDGKVSTFIADADDYLKESIGNKASLANPLAILENGEAKNKNHADNTMLSLTVAPKWQPSKNLSVEERFSYIMQSYDVSYFTPIIGMPDFDLAGKGIVKNEKQSMFTKHNAIFSDTRVDWKLPLGAHTVDVFGGVRFMNDTYTSSALQGYDTGNDKTPNMNTGLKYKYPRGVDTNWRTLSYYANADYNYKETYYLQAQLSMETSSRFGHDIDAGLGLFGVHWGLFPSVQGAWVLTNEDWFRPGRGINYLKLNAGYESVGNDGIDNNALLTYMTANTLLGESMTGIGLSNIGNPKLRWETTNRFNIGLEGNFLNNRVNAKFNYYYSKTNNLITLGTLAYVAGLRSYYTNDGSLSNTGYDFAADVKAINRKNVKLEVGASVGHYKNKLLSLPQGQDSFETEMFDGSVLSKVGHSAGVFYGYKTAGVYATSNAAEADGQYLVDNTGAKQYFKAGDMKFVDLDGNKEINASDRTVIGDPNPDIYGNIHANLFLGDRWKLSATFNYSLGNDIYNFQRAVLEGGSQFLNQTTAVTRRWLAEGQQTDIPQIAYGDPMGNSRFSDRWIEDGSYLKMKNITLSYSMPIRNEYIQGITVWGAANNLFTLTRYLGADPEVSCGNGVLLQGIDAGYLTSGRSFHLGVKINL